MADESEESASRADDREDSWSFMDLHRHIGLDTDDMAETPAAETPNSLADLAGVVRRQQALSEWRWVSIRRPDAETSGDAPAGSIWDQLGSASSVLLFGSADDPGNDEACRALLDAGPHGPTNRILVTNDQPVEERLRATRPYSGGETLVIGIGEGARSASAAPVVDGSGVATVSIPNTRDLARVGMHITRQLTEWDADDTDVVVCIHSLTTLLQTVDLNTVFRFLHVLQARIQAAGANAHYHVDPTAHDEETLGTLRPIFDAVLVADEHGDVTAED